MPLSVIQTGTTLALLDSFGALTPLTLPTGITLREDVAPRWAVYDRNVILVNTPSQPLTIDPTGTVRLLTPKPPRIAPVLSAGSAGSLKGVFRARMTFVILDAAGNVLSESDYSPFSAAATITSTFLLASNLDISPDQISARRLYRTTNNGSVYFQWVDLDGNVITSVQDDVSDAGLALVGAPVLGTPPRLTLVAEFRGRLFGVGDVDVDHVRYSEAGLPYAWPADNLLQIPPIGSDAAGCVALIPRRDALGVGRNNTLVQITGTGAETAGNIDLDVVILSHELGVLSQESVQVFRDVAYFLWKDGVYSWGPSGIQCISDGTGSTVSTTNPLAGHGNVRSWFVTDTYFNRNAFNLAFAQMVPDRPVYRLFLASAGSSVVDRWIEYDIDEGTWWGPHKTDEFSPTSAFAVLNDEETVQPMIGSGTSIYIEQATRTDGNATGINFDVIGKRHALEAPDQEKFFGEISLLGKPQASGTLSVITRAGQLNGTQTLTQPYDMRQTRMRLGRLGRGVHMQVELQENTPGTDVELFGYRVDPVLLIGRR